MIDGFAQLSLEEKKEEKKKECLVFTGAQNRTERLRVRKEHIQRKYLEEKKRVKEPWNKSSKRVHLPVIRPSPRPPRRSSAERPRSSASQAPL